MVRNDTEQRKTPPTAEVPAGDHARSFAGIDLGTGDKDLERAVLERAEKDFARLFGAD